MSSPNMTTSLKYVSQTTLDQNYVEVENERVVDFEIVAAGMRCVKGPGSRVKGRVWCVVCHVGCGVECCVVCCVVDEGVIV